MAGRSRATRGTHAETTVQASMITRAITFVNQKWQMRRFFTWRGKAEADERSWTERTASGVRTPGFVGVPAAMFATTATFALAGILPAFGIDLTGTLAAFAPSSANLGGDVGARVAAASIGLLVWFAAFAAGVQLWSIVHGKITRGQVLLGLLAVSVVVLLPLALTQLGRDRHNGEQAAAKYAQADELDAKSAAVQSEIDDRQAKLLGGSSAVPEDAEITRLKDELAALDKDVAKAEADGDRMKTLGSLTWLQIAAFFAMVGAGAYFEAAALLRIERRIPIRRARTDEAYAALQYHQDALVAIPRLGLSKSDTSGGERVATGVQVDVADVTTSYFAERIPRPVWRTWEQMRIDAAIEAQLRDQLEPGTDSAVASVIAERARRIIDERAAFPFNDGARDRAAGGRDDDEPPSIKAVG